MKASALLAMATAIVLLQAAGAGPDPDPADLLSSKDVDVGANRQLAQVAVY